MNRKTVEWTFTFARLIIALTIWGVPLAGWAEDEKIQDPLVEHLVFLGYQCDQVEQGIRAQHPSKLHVYIIYHQGGIRMQTGFPGMSLDESDAIRFQALNSINRKARVTRYYWSSKGNLFGMAWMPGLYDRGRFATFMDAWEHDAQLLRNEYEQLKPYLKESQSPTEAESS
ncbi:MAG: hypothetical protein NPIRA04_10810 [Nitrospirales bacterium]|nr:MAG: hypothetical protein NPIRA04_10810 [Nitrospirales bacterium]